MRYIYYKNLYHYQNYKLISTFYILSINIIKLRPMQRDSNSSKQQKKMQQKPTSSQAVEQTNPILSNLQKTIEHSLQQLKDLLSSSQPNQIQINNKIKNLIKLQTKFHNIKQFYVELNQLKTTKSNQQNKQSQQKQVDKQNKPISSLTQKQIQQRIQIIEKQGQQFEPSIQQILQKKQSILQEMNDDGWTDATQSETGTLGEDGIMVFDDDMLDKFLGTMNKEQDKQSQQDQEEEQQKVDLQQLEQQFVTGGESNQDYLFGQHKDKFCVSVCSVLKEGLIISGGGDDKLHFYKFNPEQIKSQKSQQKQTQKNQIKNTQVKVQQNSQNNEVEKDTQQTGKINQSEEVPKLIPIDKKSLAIKPFKIVDHHQTIDLVDLSFDQQNLFSLTEKQLVYTNIKTLQTTKLQIDPPTQLACHKQGGVYATANGFNIQVYNIKGFKFYDSYCLDEEVNILKWTLNGKQLVAACDNKLRIITPKTQQVTKVTGTAFHEGQITAMSLLQNTVFTGCIDGFVYASNLTKGHIMGGIPKLQATINTLCAAQNYLIVGPAQNFIYWYDSNKLKQLFVNQIRGSSTDIIKLATKNQYAVSDIQGQIHLFDKRSPMEQKFLLKAGNTVHQLWHQDNTLLAACQDGFVRGWDLRKYQF